MDDFDPNTIEVLTTRTITLEWTGDLFAVVDAIDYDMLMRFNTWCLKPCNLTWYARTHKQENGHRYPIFMHRVVMLASGVKPPSKFHTIVDHINGCGLDNRRENLRWATPSINCKNRYGTPDRAQLTRLLGPQSSESSVVRVKAIHEAKSCAAKQPDASVRYRQLELEC